MKKLLASILTTAGLAAFAQSYTNWPAYVSPVASAFSANLLLQSTDSPSFLTNSGVTAAIQAATNGIVGGTGTTNFNLSGVVNGATTNTAFSSTGTNAIKGIAIPLNNGSGTNTTLVSSPSITVTNITISPTATASGSITFPNNDVISEVGAGGAFNSSGISIGINQGTPLYENWDSVIGGSNNDVRALLTWRITGASIFGGANNSIGTASPTINDRSDYAVVLGGKGNSVIGQNSSVFGGFNNSVTQSNSFAIGSQATVGFSGAGVINDGNPANAVTNLSLTLSFLNGIYAKGNVDSTVGYTVNGQPAFSTNGIVYSDGANTNQDVVSSGASVFSQLYVTNCTGSATNYNGIYDYTGLGYFTNEVSGWCLVAPSVLYGTNSRAWRSYSLVTNLSANGRLPFPYYVNPVLLGTYRTNISGSLSPAPIVTAYNPNAVAAAATAGTATNSASDGNPLISSNQVAALIASSSSGGVTTNSITNGWGGFTFTYQITTNYLISVTGAGKSILNGIWYPTPGYENMPFGLDTNGNGYSTPSNLVANVQGYTLASGVYNGDNYPYAIDDINAVTIYYSTNLTTWYSVNASNNPPPTAAYFTPVIFTNRVFSSDYIHSTKGVVTTVSAKGIANGMSAIPNDGAMYGIDTAGTVTCGIQEAIDAGGSTFLGQGVYDCYATLQLGNKNLFGAGQDTSTTTNGGGSEIVFHNESLAYGNATYGINIASGSMQYCWLAAVNTSNVFTLASVGVGGGVDFGSSHVAHNAFSAFAYHGFANNHTTNLGIIGVSQAGSGMDTIEGNNFLGIGVGIAIYGDHAHVVGNLFQYNNGYVTITTNPFPTNSAMYLYPSVYLCATSYNNNEYTFINNGFINQKYAYAIGNSNPRPRYNSQQDYFEGSVTKFAAPAAYQWVFQSPREIFADGNFKGYTPAGGTNWMSMIATNNMVITGEIYSSNDMGVTNYMTLAVSAGGVTNTTPFNYLVNATAGTGMSIKRRYGGGAGSFTSVNSVMLNSTFTLQPQAEFSGTAVTATACLAP